MRKISSLLFFVVFAFCLKGQNNYSVICAFNYSNGALPYGDLISDGTFLYGMTSTNDSIGSGGPGLIFKIKPDGTNYTKLHDFDFANGANPFGSLVSDSVYLYGMTQNGGPLGGGAIFKIKTDGTGYTLLSYFNISTGTFPHGSLTRDGMYLYGLTWNEASYNGGSLLSIKTDGSSFSKILNLNNTLGANPYFTAPTKIGNYLYVMTQYGGIYNKGVIFKKNASTYTTDYTKLLDFDSTNGEQPRGSLINDGTFFYGMTSAGGTHGKGVIFKIKHDGTGYVNLLDFNGTNGSEPGGSLIRYGNYLYGMTKGGGVYNKGVIFKIRPDGTNYSKLHDFNGTNGGSPYGSLISDGTCLYGMTYGGGGTSNCGVVFKLCLPCHDTTINNVQTICNGSSYIIKNHVYTTSGSYCDTLLTQMNCDSIVMTKLTLVDCTGLGKLEGNNVGLRVYPNPTKEILNIEFEKANEKQIEIYVYDVSGREVLHRSLFINQQSTKLDLYKLESGIYFVKVDNEVRRFVKD